jgi:hypothetical protein
MAIIIGSLDCTDPKNGKQRLIAAVSGTPEEATAAYEVIGPYLRSDLILAPPVELPEKCRCVVPRLYACARDLALVVHSMTLGVYGGSERIQPCGYCIENSDRILAGVRVEPRT